MINLLEWFFTILGIIEIIILILITLCWIWNKRMGFNKKQTWFQFVKNLITDEYIYYD